MLESVAAEQEAARYREGVGKDNDRDAEHPRKVAAAEALPRTRLRLPANGRWAD